MPNKNNWGEKFDELPIKASYQTEDKKGNIITTAWIEKSNVKQLISQILSELAKDVVGEEEDYYIDKFKYIYDKGVIDGKNQKRQEVIEIFKKHNINIKGGK